jgi:hypothetical protein
VLPEVGSHPHRHRHHLVLLTTRAHFLGKRQHKRRRRLHSECR